MWNLDSRCPNEQFLQEFFGMCWHIFGPGRKVFGSGAQVLFYKYVGVFKKKSKRFRSLYKFLFNFEWTVCQVFHGLNWTYRDENFRKKFLVLRRRLSNFEQEVSSRFVKTPFTCLTKHCSEIVFWTILRVCGKKERESCQDCFLRVQFITLGIFLSESERNTFGPWSVNARMVIRTQSFLSDGSFLGNKSFEHFAGLKQKVLRDICQNCFPECFYW